MQLTWDKSTITRAEIGELFNQHKPYLVHLKEVIQLNNYENTESSINLPSDESLLKEVTELSQKFPTSKLKYIVDIGIGGSNLGTKAVYDALLGFFDILEPERFPKMIFLDTNDPEFLSKTIKLLENISKDEVVINVISKSGGTTETTANFELLYNVLVGRIPDIAQRVVVTTDFESKLWKKAQEKGLNALAIPKTVGGRYSVLSAVGLFPLVLCGIDIKALRQGAESMRVQSVDENFETNPAFLSAAILFSLFKKGFVINDNFFFHPELESLGKWYRQLMGESIGKEDDLQGQKVNTGLTPTVSIGSTDLHSVGQLYLGGPHNKVTTFISSQKSDDIALPPLLHFTGLVDNLESKKMKEIMYAILEGVKTAYAKKNLPFMEIVLDDLTEKSLGEYLQFKMIEMMYLGHLLNVDTFNQPNVEDYKVETKKILSESKY